MLASAASRLWAASAPDSAIERVRGSSAVVPGNQLHRDEGDRAFAFQRVDGRDVRMVDRSQEHRFLPEAVGPFGISREGLAQDLEGDGASEDRIPGLEYAAHPSAAELALDVILAQALRDRR